VLKYTTVTFLNDLATSGKRSGDVFEIITKSGETVTCKKLIFAAGIKDLLSAVDGLAECWGISVIHCPYCHGYEFKGAKTGIMANGERALHLASLVSNLTDQLTVLTNGPADFAPEQLEKLKRHNINTSEEKVTKIDHINGHIKSVELDSGTAIAFDAVYASVPFVQHTNIAEALGCQLTEQGHISVDPFQKTNVSDIFACGDCASPMRSVANAVASGSIAGAMVNKELSDIDFA
jgi:thioredoxin reductase